MKRKKNWKVFWRTLAVTGILFFISSPVEAAESTVSVSTFKELYEAMSNPTMQPDPYTIIIENDIECARPLPFGWEGEVRIKKSPEIDSCTLSPSETFSGDTNEGIFDLDVNADNLAIVFDEVIIDGKGRVNGISLLNWSKSGVQSLLIKGAHIVDCHIGILSFDGKAIMIENAEINECDTGLNGASFDSIADVINSTFSNNQTGVSLWASSQYESSFNNCIFINNSMGGLKIDGDCQVNDSLFESNAGSGIYLMGHGCRLIVSNTVMKDNTRRIGGAIYSDARAGLEHGTYVVLKDSTQIYNNIAAEDGGAVYIASGEVRVEDASLYNNKAENGGAIYIGEGWLTLEEGSNISDNRALGSGGGIYVKNGRLPAGKITMHNGIIAENTAVQKGGGIYAQDTTLTIYSGNINNNSAETGGGIYGQNGTLILGGDVSENTADTAPNIWWSFPSHD